MAANYQHIGGGENRLGRHYSRFSAFRPPAALADQSLALRKSQNAGSNRRSRANPLCVGTSSSIATYRVFGDPMATESNPPWDRNEAELIGLAVSKNCPSSFPNILRRDFELRVSWNRTRSATASRLASASNPLSNDADDASRNASWSSKCASNSLWDKCRLAHILVCSINTGQVSRRTTDAYTFANRLSETRCLRSRPGDFPEAIFADFSPTPPCIAKNAVCELAVEGVWRPEEGDGEIASL